MIPFEEPVIAGQLLANNMGAEDDLFLNPVHIILLHCKRLCVRACLPSNDQTQSEHVAALTEVN